VLSNLIDVRAAADWRAESSLAALDAGLPGGVRATLLRAADVCGTDVRRTGALAIPRPRAAQGTLVPGMRQAPSETSVFAQQDSRKKYQHATRVAANGGNATGSHPASWDPV
jgi:hypothetical protein